MIRLIKLELLKHKISTYVTASVIISVIMLGMVYLLAYIPSIENDPDMMMFLQYNNLIAMCSALNLAVFCTLSSVMASRFIIEAYSGKQVNILFSYPISRGRILLAKLICVYVFTAVAFFICNILIFSIFGLLESSFPLMSSNFTIQTFISVIEITLIMSITTSMLGIVAMGIGFIKKSIPATILSAVLFSSFFCNITFYANGENSNVAFALFFMSFTILAAMITTFMLVKNVNKMEA